MVPVKYVVQFRLFSLWRHLEEAETGWLARYVCYGIRSCVCPGNGCATAGGGGDPGVHGEEEEGAGLGRECRAVLFCRRLNPSKRYKNAHDSTYSYCLCT